MTYFCQYISNYLGEYVVFLSMFMLMPLLSKNGKFIPRQYALIGVNEIA